MVPVAQRDCVDVIVQQWASERPDVDTSSLGVLGRISRLAPIIDDRMSQIFRQYDLDTGSFDVLATLRRSGEPYELTPGELAASTMVTAGAVTQRLARLEKRGLITRSHAAHDRRKVIVALTWRGVRLIDQALASHASNELGLIQLYSTEEREILADLLRRLLVSFGNVPPENPTSSAIQENTVSPG